MPAISFSTLKEKILDGSKKQTIRPKRSTYWLQFKKGDKLIGYWKMRTKEYHKLFDSVLIEDPFEVGMTDFTDALMRLDGFDSREEALTKWFIPHYGYDPDMKFVVLRWK